MIFVIPAIDIKKRSKIHIFNRSKKPQPKIAEQFKILKINLMKPFFICCVLGKPDAALRSCCPPASIAMVKV